MVQHTLGKYQITKEKKKTKVQLTAEMSDSVKQERPIHCLLFYRGLLFHLAGTVTVKICYTSMLATQTSKVTIASVHLNYRR